MMSGKRMVLALLAVAAAVVAGALLSFSGRALLAVGDFLVVRDVLQPAGLIHVISGPDERTDYAIELYQQGLAEQIFFTGGWCTAHGYYHGQHGTERALEYGVPLEAISVDESWVTSTYSEALQLREHIYRSEIPVRSVIVVSDPHHMRRVRWTYGHVLGNEVRVQVAPVPFERSTHSRKWWADDETRRMVKSEYLKIAYYYARYQYSWGPVQRWLAQLDQS